jgi:glycyl-tRNA synthetase beta subunit
MSYWDPAERVLQMAAQKIGDEATRKRRSGKYREALEIISGLRPSVDQFFDKVLVMVEDQEIRKNRACSAGESAEGVFDHCGFFRIGRGGIRKNHLGEANCGLEAFDGS